MSDESAAPDLAALHQAALARVDRKIQVRGELRLPCVPALLDLYLKRLAVMWAAMGKTSTTEELAGLRSSLAKILEEGFSRSTDCMVHVAWASEPLPLVGIDYHLTLEPTSLGDRFATWGDGALFGQHPDARFMDLLGARPAGRLLDIGAGVGRNAIAAARRGWTVDAVELTPTFAARLRDLAAADALSIRVIEGDALALELETEAYDVVLASELTSHLRDHAQLRRLYERASRLLRPGGSFLVNVFVAADDFTPTLPLRQIAQLTWSTLFTWAELAEILTDLPFDLLDDVGVHGYERAHQPAESWPPTPWYEAWAQGYDVFQVAPRRAPIELRWLLYRRQGPDRPDPARQGW